MSSTFLVPLFVIHNCFFEMKLHTLLQFFELSIITQKQNCLNQLLKTLLLFGKSNNNGMKTNRLE